LQVREQLSRRIRSLSCAPQQFSSTQLLAEDLALSDWRHARRLYRW
jgi:hypothetical protein